MKIIFISSFFPPKYIFQLHAEFTIIYLLEDFISPKTKN